MGYKSLGLAFLQVFIYFLERPLCVCKVKILTSKKLYAFLLFISLLSVRLTSPSHGPKRGENVFPPLYLKRNREKFEDRVRTLQEMIVTMIPT